MEEERRRGYRAPASPKVARARGSLVRRAEPPSGDDDARLPEGRTPRTRVESSDLDDARNGVFGGLLTPHPASSPGERALQIALTALGLPVILATLVIVGWLDVRGAITDMRRGESPRPPMSIAHPFAWVIGALGAGVAAFAAEREPLEIAAWALVPLVSLFARRWLLGRIDARERELASWRRRRARGNDVR